MSVRDFEFRDYVEDSKLINKNDDRMRNGNGKWNNIVDIFRALFFQGNAMKRRIKKANKALHEKLFTSDFQWVSIQWINEQMNNFL